MLSQRILKRYGKQQISHCHTNYAYNYFFTCGYGSGAGLPTCVLVLLKLLQAGRNAYALFLIFVLKKTSNGSTLAWRPARVKYELPFASCAALPACPLVSLKQLLAGRAGYVLSLITVMLFSLSSVAQQPNIIVIVSDVEHFIAN